MFGCLRNLAVLAVSCSLAACAPGLGNQLSVDRIPDERAALRPDLESMPLRVHVQKCSDGRASIDVGEIDGRGLAPAGDVALSVQRALESKLKAAGIRLALFDAPSLSAEITDWKVNVRPAFPQSRVEAAAGLNVSLLNQSGNLVYRANYAGTMSSAQPFFSQSQIEEVLGAAMSEALDQVVDDSKLRNHLAMYSAERR